MPLKLTLDRKVSDKHWVAVGNSSNSEGHTAPAEVLLEEKEKNHLSLVLKADVHISKINNREVILYTNEKPVKVSSVKKGTEVEFKDFWLKLKK
jgi:hypothetical protein